MLMRRTKQKKGAGPESVVTCIQLLLRVTDPDNVLFTQARVKGGEGRICGSRPSRVFFFVV